MTFSKQFMEIFNFLTSQFGVAIDWSSDNVVPYIQDFSNRFVKYEITTSIAWIIIVLSLPVILFSINKIITKKYIDSFCYDDQMIFKSFSVMFFAVACLTAFIVTTIQIFTIIKAVTIPEQLIIEKLLEIKRITGY